MRNIFIPFNQFPNLNLFIFFFFTFIPKLSFRCRDNGACRIRFCFENIESGIDIQRFWIFCFCFECLKSTFQIEIEFGIGIMVRIGNVWGISLFACSAFSVLASTSDFPNIKRKESFFLEWMGFGDLILDDCYGVNYRFKDFFCVI